MRLPCLLDRHKAGLDRGSRCHPEHIRSAQCKLREGYHSRGIEMLRCAQHDSQETDLPGDNCSSNGIGNRLQLWHESPKQFRS